MSEHDRGVGGLHDYMGHLRRLRGAAQEVLDDAAIQDLSRHVVETHGRLAALGHVLADGPVDHYDTVPFGDTERFEADQVAADHEGADE